MKERALQFLIDAKKVLLLHGHSKGANARKNGIVCSEISGEADCYCAHGALHYISFQARLANVPDTDNIKVFAVEYLRRALGATIISEWNDHSTKEQVLAGFDCAIALAKKEIEANGNNDRR